MARLARIWGNDDEAVLDLLIASTPTREAVRSYVEAWLDLLEAAKADDEPPKALIQTLSLLDGHWGTPRYDPDVAFRPEWGRLAPFHPWRLGPLLTLADYALASIGTPQLGSQIRWALDRVVPAYPVMWTGFATLALSAYADGQATYRSDISRTLVRAASGAGLVQLARSFVAFHPYARDGLAITLVNPPSGQGVSAGLRRIRDTICPNLDVRVVTTTGDTADLEILEESRFLGRFPTIDAWIDQQPANSHITVVFTETLPAPGARMTASGPIRGSHVHLLLTPAVGPIGSTDLRAEVTLVPSDDNRLVLAPLGIAHVIGGDEALMNASPSLAPSELASLKRVSSSTEWLVVGVPGPVGTVSQRDLDPERLLIGRQDFGPYGLYVFAHGPYALRRFLAQWVRNVPVELTAEQLDAQVSLLAERSDRQLLALSRASKGVTETLGILTALEIERALHDPDDESDSYETFYLPLDEVGWTQYWLTEGLRADFLRIDVARKPEISPVIRIRAIEAKGSKALASQLSATNPPWREACEQIRATLESLSSIHDVASPDSLADLRFTAFCEHVVAIALSKLSPLANTHMPILANLSAFSARALSPGEVQFDGVAVATFFGALFKPEAVLTRTPGEANWPLTLAKASGQVLTALLTGKPLERLDPKPASEAENPEVGQGPAEGTGVASNKADADSGAPASSPEATDAPSPPPEGPVDNSTGASRPTVDGDILDLARLLHTACERRGFMVGRPESGYLRAGPTLVSISLPLAAGRPIREIAAAEKDLAREVGVEALEVQNDPERPFFVRFIMLRPHREFPDAPAEGARPISTEDAAYLGVYLGQSIDGTDQEVFISSWPHALVGGTTGSGKTTLLRSILSQVAARDPDLGRIIVVDGKGETDYYGLGADASFQAPFVGAQTDPDSAIEVVRWTLNDELPRRRQLMRNIAESQGRRFDAREAFLKAVQDGTQPPFSPLLIVIDEFGDLMLRGQHRAEFEQAVQSIGATGRSSMVHLVLATQRPERQVVPGIIKGNLPCRIALSLPTTADSLTILGHAGAERLAGRGDMLYEPPEGSTSRLQGYRS